VGKIKKLPEIKRYLFSRSSEFFGKCFIVDPENPRIYLHSDGKWRNRTYNYENGEWTGYFDTEEEARAAIEKHERSE
jgi:hypothetical protein